MITCNMFNTLGQRSYSYRQAFFLVLLLKQIFWAFSLSLLSQINVIIIITAIITPTTIIIIIAIIIIVIIYIKTPPVVLLVMSR